MPDDDPRLVLAYRLRFLREKHTHNKRITQHQLAQALGGTRLLSIPLISGWESVTNPKIPAARWIELYAAEQSRHHARPRANAGCVLVASGVAGRH
jgi:hypothetical protein